MATKKKSSKKKSEPTASVTYLSDKDLKKKTKTALIKDVKNLYGVLRSRSKIVEKTIEVPTEKIVEKTVEVEKIVEVPMMSPTPTPQKSKSIALQQTLAITMISDAKVTLSDMREVAGFLESNGLVKSAILS